MADWTLSWVLQKDGSTVDTFNGNPYKPSITQAGNYTAILTAVKGIFEGQVTNTFTVASPVCGPPPGVDQLAISINCPGPVCNPNTNITFKVSTFQYTRQNCDVYKWSIPGVGTKTGEQVTFNFTSTGNYTVTLNASNSADPTGTSVQQSITISPTGGGDPDPGPTCARPTGIGVTYSGPNCGVGTPCKTGDRINFTVFKNNGDSLSSQCSESATWSWGDGTTGSGRVTNHTYSTSGNKTVSVTVTSPAGNATPFTLNVPIQNAGCAGSATVDNLVPSFRGAETRCSALNGAFCRRGENIQFDVSTFDYTFQACDQFAWTFGDGTTSNEKNPIHAYTGSAPAYTATLRVYNTANPTGATVSMTVPFDNAPIQPQPNISVTGPRSAGKGATVTFTANSDIPATNWVWNFGDGTGNDSSQASIVGSSSTITHVFNKISTGQGFNVTVSAKNAVDTTDRSTASAAVQVAVSETPVYRFLLPAVIHAGGQNNSVWRTDVQVYYGAPSPSAEPLNLTAEFNGASTPLLINQSTFIYEDFMSRLAPGRDAQGPVILTTQTKYKPQIWTRTYNVDSTGRTFGQFIPAVSLDDTTGSAVDGSVDPAKYYLAGLRENTRYRTNLGFINPNTTEVIADVIAYDDIRLPLAHFTVTMAPFQLVSINGLGTKIPNVPNRPITLEITVPAGKWLVAYASFIDGVSNDPAYIPAISDAELSSVAYATGITPGVGHVGDWRSDVTVFNPDSATMRFDLEYYDEAGLLRGQARDIILPGGQLKSYEDLLRTTGLWASAPPDGLGMLRLRPTTAVTRYPLTFSRTYNDKGTGGTFGQGIPGFGAANANVKPGKSAIIPGVRSDANYKTNIGLTNITANAANVKVSLLDPNTGAVAREISVPLAAYQSVVGAFDFGGLERGTFKVEITSGVGEVWAFASIINQGNDPEYVPGIPIQ
jgi:PKD repeat protein